MEVGAIVSSSQIPTSCADTSSVSSLGMMFKNSPVDGQSALGIETLSSSSMKEMFSGAVYFSQDLSAWNVQSLQNSDVFTGMFSDTKMATEAASGTSYTNLCTTHASWTWQLPRMIYANFFQDNQQLYGLQPGPLTNLVWYNGEFQVLASSFSEDNYLLRYDLRGRGLVDGHRIGVAIFSSGYNPSLSFMDYLGYKTPKFGHDYESIRLDNVNYLDAFFIIYFATFLSLIHI